MNQFHIWQDRIGRAIGRQSNDDRRVNASDGPRLIEHASFWTLPVHGAVVVAFELTDGDGSMGRFDVEVDPVSLGPALRPAKATVRDAVAEKGGALDQGTGVRPAAVG